MLTIFQSPFHDLSLMQTSWSAKLNPLLDNPLNNVSILSGIVLSSGDNTINHKLGKKLQGWFIVGQNASATFYDKQASNSTPQLTLVLNSSAAVTVAIGVF